ncbi:MAG: LrgB family protein [Bacteroidales bacterium]
MRALFTSEIAMLLLCVGAFFIGKYIFVRTKIALFNPLLISMILIIPTLYFWEIDYSVFNNGTKMIQFFLSPTVVALGFMLYEQIDTIKANLKSILVSISIGSFISIASIVIICKLLGTDVSVISSLIPKSVTTPIALSLSKQMGGIEALTAVSVIITGILGNIIAVPLFRILGIKNRIAKGLALGSSAHAIGTMKAMEIGSLEGAISGLAIGVTGVITALLSPFFYNFLG